MQTNLQKEIEQTGACPFGIALVKLRKEKGLSQSRLNILGELNVTSLRKIEKGQMQPGISIAVRLVIATGADIGDFFTQLAESENLMAPIASSHETCKMSEVEQIESLTANILTKDLSTVKSLFGLLFSEFRRACKVSQKTVAEFAKYDLRNILNIENGTQDTGVMHALAMTSAVAQKSDIKIDVFFRALQVLMLHQKKIIKA